MLHIYGTALSNPGDNRWMGLEFLLGTWQRSCRSSSRWNGLAPFSYAKRPLLHPHTRHATPQGELLLVLQTFSHPPLSIHSSSSLLLKTQTCSLSSTEASVQRSFCHSGDIAWPSVLGSLGLLSWPSTQGRDERLLPRETIEWKGEDEILHKIGSFYVFRVSSGLSPPCQICLHKHRHNHTPPQQLFLFLSPLSSNYLTSHVAIRHLVVLVLGGEDGRKAGNVSPQSDLQLLRPGFCPACTLINLPCPGRLKCPFATTQHFISI